MTVNVLTEHHLEFLSLLGGCTGSSESIHAKVPHCWKSHVAAHILLVDQSYTARENNSIFILTYFYVKIINENA